MRVSSATDSRVAGSNPASSTTDPKTSSTARGARCAGGATASSIEASRPGSTRDPANPRTTPVALSSRRTGGATTARSETTRTDSAGDTSDTNYPGATNYGAVSAGFVR